MLDYAQLSAGQFRKLQCIISLPKTVNEIIDIMNFKANELGISIKTIYKNFTVI